MTHFILTRDLWKRQPSGLPFQFKLWPNFRNLKNRNTEKCFFFIIIHPSLKVQQKSSQDCRENCLESLFGGWRNGEHTKMTNHTRSNWITSTAWYMIKRIERIKKMIEKWLYWNSSYIQFLKIMYNRLLNTLSTGVAIWGKILAQSVRFWMA